MASANAPEQQSNVKGREKIKELSAEVVDSNPYR